MTWLAWCLLAAGLVVWSLGAWGQLGELAEYFRGGRRPGDGDQVDQGGADPGHREDAPWQGNG